MPCYLRLLGLLLSRRFLLQLVRFIVMQGFIKNTEVTMKIICSKRDGVTTNKKLRREGFVPGVIYGKNLEENINIQTNLHELSKQKSGMTIGAQIELVVDGESYATMLKDFDLSVMKKDYLHLDFQVLTSGEKIKTSAPINFINKDDIREEGNVQEYLHAVEYEVLPKDMIDAVDVDLSKLTLANDIKVGDLDIVNDDRYHVLTDVMAVVATLAPIQEVVLETEDTAQVAQVEAEAEEEE